MPGKLKVLVALQGVAIVLALIGQSWFSLVINSLLLVGVLKGSEGARTALLFLAGLGVLGAAFIAVVGAMGLATGGFGFAFFAFLTAAFAGGVNGFTIWCLRQWDVQQWMFNKSLKSVG